MPPKKDKGGAAAASPSSSIDPAVQLQQASFVRSALEATNLSLRARLGEMGREHVVLRETRAELARDAQDFLDYSTRELRLRADEVAALRDQQAAAELQREREVRSLQAELAAQAAGARATLEALEAELSAKLRERDAQLLRAQQFLDMRSSYEATMAEQAATIERERAAADTKVADLERRLIIQRVEFDREAEASFQATKARAKEEVLRQLDEDTRRIFADNKRMALELAMQTAECKTLSEERSGLAEVERSLRSDLELLQSAEKQWAQSGAGKERSNRELLLRSAELEALLTQERRDRVAEYGGLMRAIERETEDMRLELAGLRSLMALKNRELRTVKRLAQIVLSQRTEVEQFFLDALTQVKVEVARKKAAAVEAARAFADPPTGFAGSVAEALQPVLVSSARGGGRGGIAAASPQPLALQLSVAPDGSGSVTLASLMAASGRVVPGGASQSTRSPAAAHAARPAAAMADPRVDIADLTPEDRERVLRLLFAKINNLDNRALVPPAQAAVAAPAATDELPHEPPRPPLPLERHESLSESKGQGAEEEEESFAVAAPFGLAADLLSDLRQMQFRGGGSGRANSSDDIDASELALALGQKAQERIVLAEAMQAER